MKRFFLLATIGALAFLANPASGQNTSITKEELRELMLTFKSGYPGWSPAEKSREIGTLAGKIYYIPRESREDLLEFLVAIMSTEKDPDDQLRNAWRAGLKRGATLDDLKFYLKKLKSVRSGPPKEILTSVIADSTYPDAVEYCERALKRGDPSTRAGIIDSEAHRRPQTGVSRAVTFLRDKNESVRWACVRALNRWPDYYAFEPLLAAMEKEKVETLKEAMIRLLEKLTDQAHGDNADRWREWWKNSSDVKIAPVRIERAIEQGAKDLVKEGWDEVRENERELVAYTLIHAGHTEDDAILKEAVKHLLEMDLQKVYNVSIAAMALQAINAEKYQGRIAEFAWWLMANQTEDGAWHYGDPKLKIPWTETPERADEGIVITGEDDAHTITVHPMRIPIPKRIQKRLNFDNSNSQYALLGLRACADAGIVIPRAVWSDAEKHWRKCHLEDGGWGYSSANANAKGYGSMTTAGIAALSIALHYQGKNYRKDRQVKAGARWLEEHFSVLENPERATSWHYYYLYGLERAGTITGMETFGKFRWYHVGARYLLSVQKDDAGWSTPQDTCFAILFLRRATKTLVPNPVTESGRR
jgi:hypothetical protein